MKKSFNIFQNTEFKQRIIHSEAVIGFICFMFCVFAPFEIYLSSKSEFFFEGYEMISFFVLCLGAAFVGLSVINIICMLIGPKIHNLFFAVLFSLGLAFYIQGNYIQADYGVLDGNSINWQDYKVEGLISHGLFILLLVLGIVLLKKAEITKYMKFCSGVSVCVVLVQLVTLATLMLTSGGLGKEPVYVSTTEGEFSYSPNENMFVILLDTFDARVMNELLQSEDAEMCKEVLTDFTYYPNTVAMYSNTKFAVPNILSDVEATDDMTYEEYIFEAFREEENDFYKLLAEKSWDCRMYSDVQLPDVSEDLAFENINQYTLTVSSHRRLVMYMVKLVGFRYMPQCLKEYFWFYSDDMKDMIDIESETEDIFYWGNTEFYEGIDSINTENKDGLFAFYHLEGTHLPFYTTRDMVRTKTEMGINEEGLAMMNMLNKFFSKLKELGIYDSSIIVVMADHGHYDYHQNPVFMVKGINEHHEFEQSDNCFTYENVQETWFNLLYGLTGEAAVVIDEDDDEQRIFYEVDKEELSEMLITDDVTNPEYTGMKMDIE